MTTAYVNAVSNVVDTVTVVTRWFKGVVAHATDAQLEALNQMPFVRSIEHLAPVSGRMAGTDTINMDTAKSDWWKYLRRAQLAEFGDTLLERAGWTGKGVRIAIFDAGFNKANVFQRPPPSFPALFTTKSPLPAAMFAARVMRVVLPSIWCLK